MKFDEKGLLALAALLVTGNVSAITLTGLTPSTMKVEVGKPVVLTLTAVGIPATGPPSCFFAMTPGDGLSSYPGPEAMLKGFVSGSATLQAFSYPKAGTFTVTVAPRDAHQGMENSLQIAADDYFASLGVQPCQGSATATITVWDPYHEPARHATLHMPAPPEGVSGPSKPGPGPVETTMLHPGAAVSLNPQPLPPGNHTESLQTGRGPLTSGGTPAFAAAPAPRVRAASVSPIPVREGAPVRLAVVADRGCTGVRIGWGDGSTQDQSLDPRVQQPIQHVYRKPGAETVTVAGEHGCLGQAMAAETVMAPLGLVAPLKVAPATHR